MLLLDEMVQMRRQQLLEEAAQARLAAAAARHRPSLARRVWGTLFRPHTPVDEQHPWPRLGRRAI